MLLRNKTSLLMDNDKPLVFYKIELKKIIIELEEFLSLEENKYMHEKSFARKMMLPHEIKSNNSIEDYRDDIEVIIQTLKNDFSNKDIDRIKNLYNGYQYILEGKDISRETLKTLYSILSRNILDTYDLENMGEYYREKMVYIHNNIYFSSIKYKMPEPAIKVEDVERKMDFLLSYLNDKEELSITEHYIKSMIAHLYFVYIHPYFDVNGRTSRTLSMQYLLNNEAYPFIIFNRAVENDEKDYVNNIVKAKRSRDATSFIKLMLENVKKELEKEYIINLISQTINEKITDMEHQTLLYLLTMKRKKTVKDFAYYYSTVASRKKINLIKEDMLDPLFDKQILIPIRETKDKTNIEFEIMKIGDDKELPDKIKRIQL